MKKQHLSLLMLLVAGSLAAAPHFSADTSGVITYNKRIYRIDDKHDQITVTVYDENGRPNDKIYETRFQNGSKETVWQLSEVVTFPFSDLIGGKKKTEKRSFDPHWAGLGFGFCNAMGSGGFIDDPRGVSVNFGRSFEIFWNIFTVHYPLSSNRLAIVSGVGLDWRNYVMNDNRRFIKDGNTIRVEEIGDGQSLDYSRLKTLDLTLPLLLEWQSGRKGQLFLSFGPVFGIKTYSSLKTIYSDNDSEKKNFKKRLPVNPVNLDLLLQGGFKHVGLYVKYSPFNIFQQKYAPQMHAFSTGLMLVF